MGTFKREFSVIKLQNTKHDKTSCAQNQKLYKWQLRLVFDVGPGKDKEAEDMRLVWRKEKEDEDINEEKKRNLSDNNEEEID